MIKWTFITLIVIGVCYHYYPKKVERAYHKVEHATVAAYKELNK